MSAPPLQKRAAFGSGASMMLLIIATLAMAVARYLQGASRAGGTSVGRVRLVSSVMHLPD